MPAHPPVKAAMRTSAVIARGNTCITFLLGSRESKPCCADLSDRRRRQPLVDEPLHPVALRLAGHQIAARIDAEAVDVEELTRLATRPADVAELLQRRAIADRDPFVRTVCDVEEALRGIGRQRDTERRAGAARLALDEPFLQERAVEPE